MPNDNILHNDIRVFKSKPDGPVVEISNTAVTYPALDAIAHRNSFLR